MIIRPEQPRDVDAIRAVHDAAFGGAGEGRLVDALRRAGKLVGSLVAELDGQVVGHIGFSPVSSAAPVQAYGLAPLAVRPDVQSRGIGGRLVKEGLALIERRGAGFVVVLGDPGYYARFGFGPAARRGLRDEFRGGDAFQVIELRPGSIPRDVGLVQYAPEFALVAGDGEPAAEGTMAMAMAESTPISISIRCPFDRAYEFLVSPENFPRWASGLGTSLEKSGDAWIAQAPEGPARVRFTPRNDFGVLDHFVRTHSGMEIAVPMRLIRNGDGCDVALTLFRLPGMSDEKFEQDAEWVRRDLGTLKAVLEAPA